MNVLLNLLSFLCKALVDITQLIHLSMHQLINSSTHQHINLPSTDKTIGPTSLRS